MVGKSLSKGSKVLEPYLTEILKGRFAVTRTLHFALHSRMASISERAGLPPCSRQGITAIDHDIGPYRDTSAGKFQYHASKLTCHIGACRACKEDVCLQSLVSEALA